MLLKGHYIFIVINSSILFRQICFDEQNEIEKKKTLLGGSRISKRITLSKDNIIIL